MACPDFQYDPLGRSGVGLSQGSGLDYPFLAPTDDIRYLLADLYFGFEDEGDYDADIPHSVAPYSVAYLYGLGCIENGAPEWTPTPTHAADIILKDAGGNIVFDSTTVADFAEYDWGPAWKIYEWYDETRVCRLAVHTAWSPETTQPTPRNYNVHILPEDGRLNNRAVHRLPKRVRSVSAVLDTISRQAFDLQAGNNIELLVAPAVFLDGGRAETRITINVVPGKGTGVYDDCGEPVQYIRRINDVAANKYGEFFFVASECLYVRTPLEVVTTSPLVLRPKYAEDPLAPHLEIGNDCGRCCDCNDFVALAYDMNDLAGTFREIGQTVDAALVLYQENRTRWIEGTDKFRSTLRLTLVPQSGPYIDIAGQYLNLTENCTPPVTLTFAVSVVPALAEDSYEPQLTKNATRISTSVPKCTNQPYTMGGGWGTYTAVFDGVNPYDSASVRFRLQFPGGGLDGDGVPYAVTVRLTDGSTVLTKAATLNSI
jgi:hypothetical protein